jgi:hypothetical protein
MWHSSATVGQEENYERSFFKQRLARDKQAPHWQYGNGIFNKTISLYYYERL